jgi:hypothetical protein
MKQLRLRILSAVVAVWAIAMVFAHWALESDLVLIQAARVVPKLWYVTEGKKRVRNVLLEWVRRDYRF